MIDLNYKIAENFLNHNNLTHYKITKIAGDASFRSYYRVTKDQNSYILMFAPPSHEEIKPFIKVDQYLIENNFSAPKIFSVDEKKGFILLEDFGEKTYSKILKNDNSLEFDLYKNACDLLILLHKKQINPEISLYNNATLFREVLLFIDWYLPLKGKTISNQQKSDYRHLWFDLFDRLDKTKNVTVLRDFHADNLMLINNKLNYQSVGLLDFQDALIGSKAYDLVSLLEDARRDVDEKNRCDLYDYFLKQSGYEKQQFELDYQILSLQRNIKILGIFSRLSIRDKKNYYLELIPRVYNFVIKRISSNGKLFSEIEKLLKNFL